MDTLTLQKTILAHPLMPAEKLVGMALAYHINRKTGKVRVGQRTIAEETGYSQRTVKRAVKALVEAGIFEIVHTGRASILVPIEQDGEGGSSGNICGIVEGPSVSHQMGHGWHIGPKKMSPFEYDTTYSTLAEEKIKRENEAWRREREKARGGVLG